MGSVRRDVHTAVTTLSFSAAFLCLLPLMNAAAASGLPTPAPPLDWLSGFIDRHGLWVGLLAVLLAGLSLNLTPCVYPMIPVTLAFFSGQAAGSVRRAVGLACTYVLGMSVSYAVLGVVAASTGALFGSWLQSPLVQIWIAVAIVALALSMFGLYEIRLPQAITRRIGSASTGVGGAFVMGLMVGVVAAPCIGPFIVSLLLLVSQLRNLWQGFLLFFVLGIGMGLPSLTLAVAASRLGQLPKAGAWLVWSRKALGMILLGLALFFLKPLLPARLMGLAVTGLLLGGGVYLGWLERSRASSAAFRWIRWGLGGVLVASAVAVAWPRPPAASGVTWVPYSDGAFAAAVADQRPIVIDVYADWCAPCRELDYVTFRAPDVVAAMEVVSALRIDATGEVSEEVEGFFARYRVLGLPTVLLFDRQGQEHGDLRLLGFIGPKEFLERLKQIKAGSDPKAKTLRDFVLGV